MLHLCPLSVINDAASFAHVMDSLTPSPSNYDICPRYSMSTMWFVHWCLYVMSFGPFPKCKKAKATEYCCISHHRPQSRFAPRPNIWVEHVSIDSKRGNGKQVCKDCWGLLGSVETTPRSTTTPRCTSSPRSTSSLASPPPPAWTPTSSGYATPSSPWVIELVEDPCALCVRNAGQVLVRDVDHHFHSANVMRAFVFHPPQPNPTSPFYLCEQCAKDCTAIRRSFERIVCRKEGKLKRGRKRKSNSNPQTPEGQGIMLGIHRSTSSTRGIATSTLDKRRKHTYSVVDFGSTTRALDLDPPEASEATTVDEGEVPVAAAPGGHLETQREPMLAQSGPFPCRVGSNREGLVRTILPPPVDKQKLKSCTHKQNLLPSGCSTTTPPPM